MSTRKLLRVLPLPSENWGALVGEWCCHPDPFANKPLHPQENDCFLVDTFFLVNLRSDLWHPRPELAPAEMHCLSSENRFKLVNYVFKINANLEVGLETAKLHYFQLPLFPSSALLIEGKHVAFKPEQLTDAEGRGGRGFLHA